MTEPMEAKFKWKPMHEWDNILSSWSQWLEVQKLWAETYTTRKEGQTASKTTDDGSSFYGIVDPYAWVCLAHRKRNMK